MSEALGVLAAAGGGGQDAPSGDRSFWGAIFWTSWDDVGRILVTGLLGYLLLVVLIRVLGKRTTSRMNNFDWIVTVSIGSVFASMIVLRSVSMVNGFIAIASLLDLQYGVTYLTSRYAWARWVFLSSPRLLAHDGELDETALVRERVSRVELDSALRESGVVSLDETYAVVLESDAQNLLVRRGDHPNPGGDRHHAFDNVRGFEAEEDGQPGDE